MTPPSYRGYRFPADVIQRSVWMYLRFPLSYRDVEDLLAERGIEVSYAGFTYLDPELPVDSGLGDPSPMAEHRLFRAEAFSAWRDAAGVAA